MSSPHNLSSKDVLDVKEAIFLASASNLPLELVDAIIDFAEYWPCTSVSTTTTYIARGGSNGPQRNFSAKSEDVMVLRSAPIGYCPEELEDPQYLLPLNQFCQGNTHLSPLPDFQDYDRTDEILDTWTARTDVRGQNVCRKIVFTIKSHDQGWGGAAPDRATYKGSYTWFDVGKEKFVAVDSTPLPDHDCPLSPEVFKCAIGHGTLHCLTKPVTPALKPVPNMPDHYNLDHTFLANESTLQKNLTATKESKENVITWSATDRLDPAGIEADELLELGRGRDTGNGQFVRDLKVGDVVTIWARARFPGWQNTVESAKIDVYWAI